MDRPFGCGEVLQFVLECHNHRVGWEQAAVVRERRVPDQHSLELERRNSVADELHGLRRHNGPDGLAHLVKRAQAGLLQAVKIFVNGLGGRQLGVQALACVFWSVVLGSGLRLAIWPFSCGDGSKDGCLESHAIRGLEIFPSARDSEGTRIPGVPRCAPFRVLLWLKALLSCFILSQTLERARQSGLRLCPARNDRHPQYGPAHSARPGDTPQALMDQTIVHICPRSPKALAAVLRSHACHVG